MAAPKGNKYAAGNKGGTGRPPRYKKEYDRQAEFACERGFIDEDLAKLFSVTVTTIKTWKKNHKSFLTAVEKGKPEADANVRAALYHRACGYSHKHDHIMSVGNEVRIVPTTKHYPPDVKAAIFWLCNRDRDNWRMDPDRNSNNTDDIAEAFMKLAQVLPT